VLDNNNMGVDGVQTMRTLLHVHLVSRESTKERFTYLTRSDLSASALVLVEWAGDVSGGRVPHAPLGWDAIMVDPLSLP